MTKSEWITVLTKAQGFAKGESVTCYKMFGFLLVAMQATPTRIYFESEDGTEEDEEE